MFIYPLHEKILKLAALREVQRRDPIYSQTSVGSMNHRGQWTETNPLITPTLISSTPTVLSQASISHLPPHSAPHPTPQIAPITCQPVANAVHQLLSTIRKKTRDPHERPPFGYSPSAPPQVLSASASIPHVLHNPLASEILIVKKRKVQTGKSPNAGNTPPLQHLNVPHISLRRANIRLHLYQQRLRLDIVLYDGGEKTVSESAKDRVRRCACWSSI
jgi:hypothetical protein